MPFEPGDRFRVSRDYRGAFHLNKGMEDLGELKFKPRSGPALTLGDRALRIRAFDAEWLLVDDDSGTALATLKGARRPAITLHGETFTLRRSPFAKHVRLTDEAGRTLVRFERAADGRRRSLVGHVVEPHPRADVLFPLAAITLVLKGNFKPPKERDPEGARVGRWSSGGQWGFAYAMTGGSAGAVADLSDSGAGGAGGLGGGGFGDFGGGDVGGGGGDGGGGGP